MKVQPAFRRLVAGLFFTLLLTFFLHSIRSSVSAAPDFPTRTDVNSAQSVIIEIPEGASGSEVADVLFSQGVVKSRLSYFRVAVGDARSAQVSPGSHTLTLRISAAQALDQLLDPKRIPNLIKIFEGAWRSEIEASLRTYGFTSREISTAFSALQLPKGFKSAEGLLFPAQYSFPKGTTATKAVQSMVDRFRNEQSGKDLLNSRGKYSPPELLIMASIVQAEGDSKDFAKIAAVIQNRLRISMPLQLDSTVHYIKKVRGQIFLSTDSTLINSPFNTYKHYGLPPSPIGNPGAQAIQAVLNPESGDWLYFITVAPGDTRFTRSSDEFLQWKQLYEKNRRAGAFK